MKLFCRLFGCGCCAKPSYVEIVAKQAPEGEEGAVHLLGPDGGTYALYYRTDPEGVYEPVYFVGSDNNEVIQ